MSGKFYVNHYQLKKARLVKLKRAKYRCKKCGGRATLVHHKDGSNSNHELRNLLVLCPSCHATFHKNRVPSKWKKIFGMSVKEVGDIVGLPPSQVYNELYQNGWGAVEKFKARIRLTK